MDSLVADVEAKMAEARLGGGAKASERMRAKGKKLPRERSGCCLFRLTFADLLLD
jgi:3-methylcrotonyl-CoA carboxylase beta subunit